MINNRLKIMMVSQQALEWWILENEDGVTLKGASLQSAHYNHEYQCFDLIFSSENFPEVKDGEMISRVFVATKNPADEIRRLKMMLDTAVSMIGGGSREEILRTIETSVKP